MKMWNILPAAVLVLVSGVVIPAVEGDHHEDSKKCDQACNPGTYVVQLTKNSNCSTTCIKCPEYTITNNTNATYCFSCPPKQVSDPTRTKCQPYEITVYSFARPAGIITLISLAVLVFILGMAFVIFAKNQKHELVVMCGFRSLCLFLFGCLCVLLSPVPLLSQPYVAACSAYIFLFNMGLTIIFAVLISRSAYLNGFYGDNDETVRHSCGPRPRVVFIVLLIAVQLLILLIGLTSDSPETMELKTGIWNIYYLECSNWASLIFWIALAYNVVLSLAGNFLSCSSTDMDERCQELKHVLVSYLVFYVIVLLQIIILFRVVNEALAEGQAILCILYTMAFFYCFIVPKLRVILYYTKDDGVTIKADRLLKDHEHQESNSTSIIHAKDGYKTHVVGMKIKSIEA